MRHPAFERNRLKHRTVREVDHRRFVTSACLLLLLVAFVSQRVQSAGLDSVSVTLSAEGTSADARVTVSFEVGGLSNGESITIYVGEDTSGSAWDDDSITTSHISCSDDGSGDSYTANSVTAATASLPFTVAFTATTVGSGATTVTCLIGDGGSNNPNNPSAADGYSVAVVTTDDAGAGVAYVGDANDVQVSVSTLPNLTLTIDNADGSSCTTTSGVTSCDLGTATAAAVETGNYDVNVGTSATNGATMSVQDDGNLRDGANDIDDVTENSTVTAGNEENGFAIAADASWTETAPFDDDDTPTTTSVQSVATTSGPIASSGDDVTVTHRVAVSTATQGGNYAHIMTWTATADF